MLTLPIKKKWFDMIKSGEKKEEYREANYYYWSRFAGKGLGRNEPVTIQLRNGYGNDKPTLRCKVIITQGCGKEKWGAIPGKEYFILKILEVEQIW